MSDGVESSGVSADDTLTRLDDDERDPESSSDHPDRLSPIWTSSDNLRRLLQARGDPGDPARAQLSTALTYHVPTLALYYKVSLFFQALKDRSVASETASLYVILFPGEGKDNTGIKDLNDKVIGMWWNSEYIRRRFLALSEVFAPASTSFEVVAQSYKTAYVLTTRGTRAEFVERLAKLDEKLRSILLDVLNEAEPDADAKKKKEIKKLRKKLRKKGYRFDFFFGLSTRKPSATSKLQYTYLLITEALKAAGMARYAAKVHRFGKPYAKYVKIIKPDAKKLDARGKEFDWNAYIRLSDMQEKVKTICMKGYTRDTPYVSNEIYIDTVWSVTFLDYRARFWGHPDVIRDVRKKKVKGAPISGGNLDYGTYAAALLVQVWLVVLNLLDFVKRFKFDEFPTKVQKFHDDAYKAFKQLGTNEEVDWPLLEKVLTHDVRLSKKIAVYESASEFLFYSYAADHSKRIFFSMDVRDMGVELMLHYEQSNREIGHHRYQDVPLLEETFRASDAIDERRRATYERVVEVFRKYYDKLAGPGGGGAAARKAFSVASFEKLGSFDEAVQIMLGGDEVYAAAHPLFSVYVSSIVRDLDQAALDEDRTLDLRASIAFSSADDADDATGRIKVQLAHQEALRLAEEAPATLKELERAQRRIERLIDMLEKNPAKKAKAPAFRTELEKLHLKKLFARLKHGAPSQLDPKDHLKLFELLKQGDIAGAEKTRRFELVDFDGNVVDGAKLEKEAANLENRVRKLVGTDNVRGQPPPVTEMPKWLKKLLDKWADQ